MEDAQWNWLFLDMLNYAWCMSFSSLRPLLGWGDGWWEIGQTLRADDATLTEAFPHEQEKLVLEERFGRTNWVAGICDDHVILARIVPEICESIAHVHIDFWVFKSNSHGGEVGLANANNAFVNLDQGNRLYRGVLDNLTQDTAITATNDKDLEQNVSILNPI